MKSLFIVLIIFSLNPLKVDANSGLIDESMFEDDKRKPQVDIYFLELNSVSTVEFKNRLIEAFGDESSNYPNLEDSLKGTDFKLSLKQIYLSFFKFYAKKQTQDVVDMHISLITETLESILGQGLSSEVTRRITLMSEAVFLPQSHKRSCAVYLK